MSVLSVCTNNPVYLNRNLNQASYMVKQNKSEKTSNIAEGWKLYKKHKFDDALSVFEALLEEGNDLQAQYGKACALFRIMDYEGALAELSELIAAEPENVSYHHSRALIYGADEQYDKALKDFEKLSEQHPDNGELWCDLGGLYLILEEYVKARDCFERSADIEKSCPCAWFGKGVVALYMKEFKKAHEYLNIAIKLDAKHRLAYMARAETFFSAGKKKEALKDVKKVLSSDKGFFEEFKVLLDRSDGDNDDGRKDKQRIKDLNDEDAMEIY